MIILKKIIRSFKYFIPLVLITVNCSICFAQCPTEDVEIWNSTSLQNYIDNYSKCDSIFVNLFISNTNDELEFLRNVVYVDKNFSLHDDDINLGVLSNLTTVNGNLNLGVDSTKTIDSLISLDTVKGVFNLISLENLENLFYLETLDSLGAIWLQGGLNIDTLNLELNNLRLNEFFIGVTSIKKITGFNVNFELKYNPGELIEYDKSS